MSLKTFSIFYYGYSIDSTNNLLDFSEGGPELTAELNIGAYSFEEFATEIRRALNAAGANTYTVATDRVNQKLTISTTSVFQLRTSSGTHIDNSPFALMGFTGSDKVGLNNYISNVVAGLSYAPQFILQDHVESNHFKQAIDATIHKTVSGRIEVIRFGVENFAQFNIMYANNLPQDGSIIKTNISGITALQNFMDYCITKSPVDYMPNIASRNNYEALILESSPDNSKGVGYKLSEMYDKGLPGYFSTGTLKFRVYQEDLA